MIERFHSLEDRGLPLRRFTDRAIWVVVLGFVLLGLVYSVVTPLFEASDELWHYPFVAHLASGGGLPVQDPAHPGLWRQEGSQPPLYYALAALLTRWGPASDLPQILVPNPHAQIGVPRPDGNANMVVHTPREDWPYRGATLAAHLARAFSVLLGAVTVLFTYGIGLEVLPHRPGLALAAAVVVACTPMFLFISGSVNNDNLVTALSTVGIWLLLRLLRGRPAPVAWAFLGVVIGLAALSKVSALGLLPIAAVGLAWLAWRRRDWRLFLWGGACVVGVAGIIAGWWYWRNWRLYHDPFGWNVFLAIVGRRYPRPTVLQVLGEWKGFIMAYWGFFGGVNVAPPEWFYSVFNAEALLGLVGLASGAILRLVAWVRIRRRGGLRQAPVDVDTAFRLFLMVFWPLLVFAGLIRWTMLTIASQGRLIFPAIACLSYLLVLGWSELWSALGGGCRVFSNVVRGAGRGAKEGQTFRVPHHLPRSGQYAVFLGPFVALAVWVPFGVIAPAYARPPLLTAEQIAAIPHRLDLALGDKVDLLGYRLDCSEVRPGEDLALTLYWRARAPMDKDYSTFVHLLDQNEMKISQRDSYPGRGSFPTTLWRPGDAIADTYVITVPSNTFRPNRLQLEVGLYLLDSGERLPVRDAQGRELGSSIRLGDVAIPSDHKDGIANPVEFNFDNRIALVGYDLDRTALRPGETLRLSLFWKALAPLDQEYTAFAHILASDGALWAGKVGSPAASLPANSAWRKGQVLQSTWELALPPDTPPGDYYVDTGLYPAGTGQNLSVLDRWGHALDQRAILTRIRVLAAAPEAAEPQFEFPSIQHPLDVTFGNVARLRGFSLDRDTVNPHEPLRVTLYWEAIGDAPAPVSYKVFVHLLDAENKVVAQHDGPPAYGRWPTTTWTRGQAVVDEHSVSLGDRGYAGRVLVEVGLYDAQTLGRVTTSAGDDRVILPVELQVAP